MIRKGKTAPGRKITVKQMAKKKVEHYHIYAYLCALVLVGILLTGVTLARYSGSTSGGGEVTLPRFYCSYEIDDMSSLTFANSDYWFTSDEGEDRPIKTARTVRYTVRNYTTDGSGKADRVSDLDLEPTLRFYAPAEFAGTLAFQVVETHGTDGEKVVTPQYVVSDIAKALYGTNGSDGASTYHTGKSKGYEDRTDGLEGGMPLEEELSLSGSFTGSGAEHFTGSMRAVGKRTGAVLSVTADERTAEYSVGFMRTTTESSASVGGGTSVSRVAPLFYLDCEKEVPYMTVDITLPDSHVLKGGHPTQRSYVLYVTSTVRLSENEDMNSVWHTAGSEEGEQGGTLSTSQDGSNIVEDWNEIFTSDTQNEYYFNGAKVTGYHFERDLPVCDDSGAETGKKTTVRINKYFDDGSVTFDHIAPLSEGAASVVHAINDFYTFTGGVCTEYTDPLTIDAVQSLYGVCAGGSSGYIKFEGVTDDPLESAHDEADGYYVIGEAMSKGYSTSLNVIFAQASETPTETTEEGGGA